MNETDSGDSEQWVSEVASMADAPFIVLTRNRMAPGV